MSLISLVLAGIRRAPRRYLGLTFLLLVGGAVVTVGAVLGSVASDRAETDVDRGAALRTITVYGDAAPLTEEAFAEIRSMPGVESAQPVISVPVGLEPSRVSLTLLPWNDAAPPPVVAGDEPSATGLAEGTVLLPATAEDAYLQDLLGEDVRLTFTVARTATSGVTEERRMTVVGVTDPTFQVDAPNAAYAPMDLVLELAAARAGVPADQFLAGQGYERVVVLAASTQGVEPLLGDLQAKGVHAVSQAQQLGAVPGVIVLIRVVVSVLLAALVLVGAIAVTALAQGISHARRRDIGVLKAFGWSGVRLRGVLVAEMALVCLLAQLAGTALGLVASPLVVDQLRGSVGAAVFGEVQVPGALLLVGNVVVLLFFVAVVWAVMGRAARQPVATILRSL